MFEVNNLCLCFIWHYPGILYLNEAGSLTPADTHCTYSHHQCLHSSNPLPCLKVCVLIVSSCACCCHCFRHFQESSPPQPPPALSSAQLNAFSRAFISRLISFCSLHTTLLFCCMRKKSCEQSNLPGQITFIYYRVLISVSPQIFSYCITVMLNRFKSNMQWCVGGKSLFTEKIRTCACCWDLNA